MDTKIEVVRLFRFDNGGPIKAFCDLQIGDDYIIKGFRICEGKEGLFVGMPSGVGKTGKWFHTFHPLTDKAKQAIEDAVMSAYNE